MIIRDFKGYQEGRDITKIPAEYLAYPSKNVLVHKGKIYTRLGIEVFGADSTADNKVHSEKVWKNSKAGAEVPTRVIGTTLQAYLEAWKTDAGWVDVFDGFDSDLVRVEFAEWVDTNTSIIKSRLIMVDGSENMYQWNGGIAVVESVAGAVITIAGSKTLEQLGFDDGSTTQQTVIINGTEYTYSHNPTTNDLTLDSTPSPAPVAGDLVVVKPLTHSVTLSGVEKDHIYNYKGHLVIGGLESVDLYFSHATDYSMSGGFNFTVPAPASRTALTAMYFTLDGNITAMHERKSVLWVSTADDWFKITKLYEQNGYDEWSTVEKVESAVRKGALPFAVSAHKGDMIFVAQDYTVQSVTDLEILQSDQLKLISDDIEDLLIRLDLTGCRIYYHGRYIFITVPAESTLLVLDVVAGYWQPPQTLPIECLSIIDGNRIGHSNNRNESFKLFYGKSDLGTDIEAVIALGYLGFEGKLNELDYKWYEILGFSGYITPSTIAEVENLFEYDGAKNTNALTIDGSKIKTYKVDDDASLGKHPFASRSWAGGDYATTDLARFFVFDRSTLESFFEFAPKITITGTDMEFHLTAISMDVSQSDRTRPDELFISK